MIGSRDGLFYINESTGTVKSFVRPVLTSDLILTISFYEGEYYIGTYGGGMMVLNPQTLALTYFEEGDSELFHKGHIFCIKPDEKGNLWVGTSQGVFCYNKSAKQIKNYTSSNSQLPEGNVYEISFDSTGKDGLQPKPECAFTILHLKVSVPMSSRKGLCIVIR